MPGGRPVTKFTHDARAKIVAAIRAGNHLDIAARYGGVTYQGFRKWMIKGEQALERLEAGGDVSEEEQEYLDFFQSVTEAEAMAEISAVAEWKKAIPKDWKAARDFLARRHPHRWGHKVEVAVSSRDEEILALLDAIDGTPGEPLEPAPETTLPEPLALPVRTGE